MTAALGADVPLGSWAKATLRDRSVHFGVVHTVDPEAGTVVLLVPDGGRNADTNGDADGDAAAPSTAVRPLVVFGHALSSLEPLGAPAAGAPALELRRAVAEAAPPDAAALARRHDALCALLRRRHLPFESRGGVIAVLGGVLRVAPPYTERSCTCENETVLGRFFALLEALDAEGAADPG